MYIVSMPSELPNLDANISCPLCLSEKTNEFKTLSYKSFGQWKEEVYLNCTICDLRFLRPDQRLAGVDEKKRYETHNNDSNDPRYLEFLKPAIELSKKHLKGRFSENSKALDLGCGAGRPFNSVFTQMGLKGFHFDPYFFEDPKLLEQKYCWLTCTEVIEHVYDLNSFLDQINHLLEEKGLFTLMTGIYYPNIKFEEWWYVKDPTHVCFLTPKTLEYIASHWGYRPLEQQKNIVIFEKIESIPGCL